MWHYVMITCNQSSYNVGLQVGSSQILTKLPNDYSPDRLVLFVTRNAEPNQNKHNKHNK